MRKTCASTISAKHNVCIPSCNGHGHPIGYNHGIDFIGPKALRRTCHNVVKAELQCSRDVHLLFLQRLSGEGRELCVSEGGVGPDGFPEACSHTQAQTAINVLWTRPDVVPLLHRRPAHRARTIELTPAVQACHALLCLLCTLSSLRLCPEGWAFMKGADWAEILGGSFFLFYNGFLQSCSCQTGRMSYRCRGLHGNCNLSNDASLDAH